MAEPLKLKLRTPVEFGKDTIEELTFRRGRMGDMKGVPIGDSISMDTIMLVASRLSGQPTAVIERLDEADAGEVVGLAMGFIGRCLATGSGPSPS